MDHENIVHAHTNKLAEIEASTKSAHKRLDNIDRLIDTMHEVNKNVSIIAEQTRQQGEQLKEIVVNLKDQDKKIDDIEDKMGTKETIIRLHERIDELEKKDGKKAEKLLGQVKWLLISLIIMGVAGLVWSAIANK